MMAENDPDVQGIAQRLSQAVITVGAIVDPELIIVGGDSGLVPKDSRTIKLTDYRRLSVGFHPGSSRVGTRVRTTTQHAVRNNPSTAITQP